MNLKDAMKDLEANGTEQARKTYRRHGAPDPMFGVSFAHLGKLQKKILQDHALASALWATENLDARILATMIADPAAMSAEELDAWAKGSGGRLVIGYVAGLAARTPHAQKLAKTWTASKNALAAGAGYAVISWLASKDASVPDAFFEPFLAPIERGIHSAPNRVREAMNGALIAIGIRAGSAMAKEVISIARRIGPVEIDHGETACKTRDAVPYIEKGRARRKPARA